MFITIPDTFETERPVNWTDQDSFTDPTNLAGGVNLSKRLEMFMSLLSLGPKSKGLPNTHTKQNTYSSEYI